MFAVTVSSEIYGDTIGVGHGIDERGLVVDMCYVPPRGAVVNLLFVNEADQHASMTARARSLGVVGELEVGAPSASVRLEFIAFTDPALDEAGIRR